MRQSQNVDVLIVSNRYDHLGRRVQKTTPEATHTYFYDGWLLIKETRHPAASQSWSDAAGSRVSMQEDGAGSRVSFCATFPLRTGDETADFW